MNEEALDRAIEILDEVTEDFFAAETDFNAELRCQINKSKLCPCENPICGNDS